MKLITQKIARQLMRADLDNPPPETAQGVAVKFFTPWANATWYIVSATPLDANGEPLPGYGEQAINLADVKDWHMFGFADLGDPQCAELGYVLLSQLTEIRGPWGLRVERDMHYRSEWIATIIARYRKRNAA